MPDLHSFRQRGRHAFLAAAVFVSIGLAGVDVAGPVPVAGHAAGDECDAGITNAVRTVEGTTEADRDAAAVTNEVATLFAPATSMPAAASPGALNTVLWYLPNRIMDLVDIFRLRLKVGPGLGVTARLTDYASVYAGSQRTLYLGLPGPRYPDTFRWPVGLENQKGLVLVGVDASDDVTHPPRYGLTEADVGVHLGVVGAEVGVDAFEIADFFSGLLCIDLRRDDYPRARPRLPERGSVLAYDLNMPGAGLPPKPAQFPALTNRLDYLRANVPLRLSGQIGLVDSRFVAEGTEPIPQPVPQELELAIFVRTVFGDGTKIDFKPKMSIDVDLPNLERQVRLFVESASDDDLPGRDSIDREDNGWTLGVRKQAEDWNITTDLGIRARWLPELYARTSWRPHWSWGHWRYGFDQRFFWESEDGFGMLTTLGIHRWFADQRWIYRQTTSGRLSESTDGYEWSQNVIIGRATRLVDEARRRRGTVVGAKDAVAGYAVTASVFGEDSDFTEGRLLAGFRTPMYRDFVVADIRAGPQWREEEDWRTELRTEFGLVLLF